MIRTRKILFASLIMVLVGALPAQAQKRIALVIGNSNYTRMQMLTNPANDARLMSETLAKVGFEVISANDVDFLRMRRAVKKFGQKLRGAGKDAVGLFFYAGHGVQAQGVNFLVPLGAEVSNEADLEIETIAASDVLAQMEAAGNTLNLVILDACRNNPFKSKSAFRSVSRGLARLNAASGSLVAFAAAPGQVAADGASQNSPYTEALVKAMQIPGLSVEQMFKQVRVSVEAKTNRQQTPWEESSLRGDFYFTPEVHTARLRTNLDADQLAAREWETIQNTRSPAVLKAFIDRHPQSIYATYARTTLDENTATKRSVSAPPVTQNTAPARPPLVVRPQQIDPKVLELSFWNAIKNRNNISLFRSYLQQYPQGTFSPIAVSYIQALTPKPRLAAITPPPPPAPVVYQLSTTELTLRLQRALTRLGCNPGKIDGQWGQKGRNALARFKRLARVNLPFDDLSPEVFQTVAQGNPGLCYQAPPRVKRQPTVRTGQQRRKATRKVIYTAPKPARKSKRTQRDKNRWAECVMNSFSPGSMAKSGDCR